MTDDKEIEADKKGAEDDDLILPVNLMLIIFFSVLFICLYILYQLDLLSRIWAVPIGALALFIVFGVNYVYKLFAKKKK